MDVPHVVRHLGFTPEEALPLSRSVPRRIFIIRNGAGIAPINPALLTMLHSEVNLYSHPGVEGVPAQGAPVQMMSVTV